MLAAIDLNNPVNLLILLGVLIILITAIVASLVSSERSVIEERLGFRDDKVRNLTEIERGESFQNRVIKPFVNGVVSGLNKRLRGASREELQKRLTQAGIPLQPAQFLLLQLVALILGAILSGIFIGLIHPNMPLLLLVPVIIIIFAYLSPRLIVDRRGKKRKTEVLRGLPPAIDILAMCLRSGLAFDAAMSEVSSTVGSSWVTSGITEALRKEFEKAVEKVKMGQSTVKALREIGENTGVNEMTRFANAIAHAEEFGTPIGDILDIQAEDLRRERRQRAQTKGQRAGLKMLFPMLGCIFPTLFILLLGPAILSVLKIFHG